MKPDTKPLFLEEADSNAFLLRLTEIRDCLIKIVPFDVQYFDNSDLKRMLHVSDSTLHRMRKAKDIPYQKIRGKFFYPKSFFNNAFKTWRLFYFPQSNFKFYDEMKTEGKVFLWEFKDKYHNNIVSSQLVEAIPKWLFKQRKK